MSGGGDQGAEVVLEKAPATITDVSRIADILEYLILRTRATIRSVSLTRTFWRILRWPDGRVLQRKGGRELCRSARSSGEAR